MLELRNVTKTYGHNKVVEETNLVINQGEFFCLLGPSGCGKTTILRMIAGFEKATSGSILLDDKDITSLPPFRRDVNTVFQNYALFPNYSVLDNISYGLRIRKTPKEEVDARTEKVIRLAGLKGFESRMPSQLSGGQQQRVALARALVNEPRILLLDEPLSALDKKIAEQTRIELANLQREVGITFIFVTHNQSEALAMADRIAVMNSGRIEQCDPPRNIYEHPRSRFVADFIGNMNVLNGAVTSVEDGLARIGIEESASTISLTDPGSFRAGDRVIFCIRPERMKISLLESKPYENSVPGIIRSKVYLGDVTEYQAQLKGGKMIRIIGQNYLLQWSNEFFEVGEEVNIIWSQTSGELIHA